MVPHRPIPSLRKYRLATQSGRDPLWLYIGRESAAFVWWIRGIRVPSMECRSTSRAEKRYAGTGRTGHTYGERRRMVALRRRGRLQLRSTDSRAGPTGTLADSDLQV